MTEIINTYIVPVVLIICLCVGYIIKHFIPSDKVNRYIPVIVGALGVFISIWNAGWSVTPDTIVIGLVSGLASTGMHEAFSQIISKKRTDLTNK